MDDKRWHERRHHKRYHWLKDREGRWHPESFKDNGEPMVTRLAKLVDAIMESWTKCLMPPYGDGLFTPEDGQTDCNGFVHMVASKLGYKDFKPGNRKWPLRANQIHAHISNSKKWTKVNGSTAQYYANHGYLVVAAWTNPDAKKSGHVAIVRPGMTTTSGKWRIFIPGVPKVANVGNAESCRLNRGSNWAFNEMPDYFTLMKEKRKTSNYIKLYVFLLIIFQIVLSQTENLLAMSTILPPL